MKAARDAAILLAAIMLALSVRVTVRGTDAVAASVLPFVEASPRGLDAERFTAPALAGTPEPDLAAGSCRVEAGNHEVVITCVKEARGMKADTTRSACRS